MATNVSVAPLMVAVASGVFHDHPQQRHPSNSGSLEIDMKAQIFWRKNETEDSIVLEANTLDELRMMAAVEIDKRQLDDYWSEILEE
jgi:hypothetical protein